MSAAELPRGQRSDAAYLRRRRFARECALQYLYQADQQHDWECTAERLQLFRQQISDLDTCPPDHECEEAWKFAERLIRGVCAERGRLDVVISEHALNWTLARMAVVDRNILRLAAFELLYCDDIPDVASVDEAIELTNEFGHKDSHRFVNGILDRLLQERRAAVSAVNDAADRPADGVE